MARPSRQDHGKSWERLHVSNGNAFPCWPFTVVRVHVSNLSNSTSCLPSPSPRTTARWISCAMSSKQIRVINRWQPGHDDTGTSHQPALLSPCPALSCPALWCPVLPCLVLPVSSPWRSPVPLTYRKASPLIRLALSSVLATNIPPDSKLQTPSLSPLRDPLPCNPIDTPAKMRTVRLGAAGKGDHLRNSGTSLRPVVGILTINVVLLTV